MFGQQRAGERLRIAAWDREGEQIFDQFVIEQSLRPLLDQPFAQAGAVAAGIGGGVGHYGCVKRLRRDSTGVHAGAPMKPSWLRAVVPSGLFEKRHEKFIAPAVD